VVLALHFIIQRKVVAGITDQGRCPVARYLELDRSTVPDGPPSPCKTISQHDTTFYSIQQQFFIETLILSLCTNLKHPSQQRYYLFLLAISDARRLFALRGNRSFSFENRRRFCLEGHPPEILDTDLANDEPRRDDRNPPQTEVDGRRSNRAEALDGVGTVCYCLSLYE
jgi:hypothetical protein